MLGLIVFLASFISIFVGTLLFPSMPPGSLVVNFFGNIENSTLIAGISGDLFISALLNGLCWSLIVTLAYLFWKGPDKKKKNMPVWVPGYAKSRNSKD